MEIANLIEELDYQTIKNEIQTIFNKPMDLLFENRHTISVARLYEIFEHDCPKSFKKILFCYLIKFLFKVR